ncbi:MAG: hypothetical protein RBS85_06915 [Methanofastidiosum sp.]|jgi:hypothetical protein|nr:hypothetical protein [Methanofastidiosum sp.]
MKDESSVNVLYDLVEYMERERKRLLIATAIVLLLVPLALTLNLSGFFLMTKRILLTDSETSRIFYKSGMLVMPLYFLVTLNALTSIALVFLGVKNLLFLKSWGKKLRKIEKIEKKIYEEVIKDEDITEED